MEATLDLFVKLLGKALIALEVVIFAFALLSISAYLAFGIH